MSGMERDRGGMHCQGKSGRKDLNCTKHAEIRLSRRGNLQADGVYRRIYPAASPESLKEELMALVNLMNFIARMEEEIKETIVRFHEHHLGEWK